MHIFGCKVQILFSSVPRVHCLYR